MVDLALLGGPYKTVFDVGGNVGRFAEAAHRRWPEAEIYSFEPAVDVAARNSVRADGRWEVFPFGLADRPGERWLNRVAATAETTSLLEPGPLRRDVFGLREHHTRQAAFFQTLDADTLRLLVHPPALLKIDVEGAERLVIEGGRRVIPRFDSVVIEVNVSSQAFIGSPTTEEIEGLMRELGFVDVDRVGELRHPESGELLQYDGFWRRKDA